MIDFLITIFLPFCAFLIILFLIIIGGFLTYDLIRDIIKNE
jgi:hypothetical protein